MKTLLTINDVSLTYQTDTEEIQALDGLDFSVAEGEFVSIIGPSGCGKTTVLSIIAGLLSPTKGSVFLNGKPVSPKSGNLGYMLQKDQLFPWRTIEKNVLLPLEIQKKLTPETKAYALKLLEKYGLKDFKKSYPDRLSGGMRQRVALIRTLVSSPELLLLDEPFSALDYQTRIAVADDVHSIIKAEKKTAILVTHDISEAISVSDKIIVLSARPAKLKDVFTPDFSGLNPLERRSSPEFGMLFDTIWKELN